MKPLSRTKSTATDMTDGSIIRCLVIFALPVMFGEVFQKLYNTVDAWVLGNYVSDEAFSAVGTVSPIISLLINTFSGFTSGATILVARYYGARDSKQVHQAIHTAFALALVMSVLFTAIGMICTPWMLRLTKTPDDVFADAHCYLSIYFAGIGGMLLYNMSSSILRAIGNTRLPSTFLVISAVLNVILDLIFVLIFDLGIAGVAWATVIAQATSAVLAMLSLMRSEPLVRLTLKSIRFHWETLRLLVTISIPAALQFAVTAFSNVFCQAYINTFGKYCMGGWTAYLKICNFTEIPLHGFSVAAATFVGQNLGAKQPKRAKKGVRTALLLSGGASAAASAVALIFAPQLLSLFSDSEEVVRYGTIFLYTITTAQVLHSTNQVLVSSLRGSGNTKVPMIVVLTSFVFLRQCFLYAASTLFPNNAFCIALAYPITWGISACTLAVYYWRVGLRNPFESAPSAH